MSRSRRGRQQAGAGGGKGQAGDSDGAGRGASQQFAGEAGTYGCLAIDNIYNVMNFNDRKSMSI